MPMFNLLSCFKNFRKITGSFWNYYPDKPKSGYDDEDNERERIFYPIKDSESFAYKTKLVGNVPGGVETELPNIKIIVPLKNFSNFIFSLNFLMINTDIELILKWSQNCVLTEKVTREAKEATQDPPQDREPPIKCTIDLKLSITDCKLYVPVVTLQEKYENELYEGFKSGISFDFEWGRYRTQIINQPATNNLNFLIDPTFNNLNGLFVLAFPNEEDLSSFSKYYMPAVEIKDYNVLIDLQPFHDIPIKNKEQTYKEITELFNHDNYTTGNSLTYEYFCNHYKLIAIDLSKQNSEFKNQQINFIGKLEQNVTIFFITEELITAGINFKQNTVPII